RISIQLTPPTGPIHLASSAARCSHPIQVGSNVVPSAATLLGRKRGSISCVKSSGANSARAKKYACGRRSASLQAAAAFAAASLVIEFCKAPRNNPLVAFRNPGGKNRAVAANLSAFGTLEKVG